MKMPPMKGAKEYTLNKLYSTQTRHNCKNCGILTHWPLCPSCYRWRIHFSATQQVVKAMRGCV